MQKKDEHIISMLPRYFSNELGSDEIKEITEWVEICDDNRRVFEEIRDIWYSMNAEDGSKRFDSEEAWSRYSKWIDKHKLAVKQKNRSRKIATALLKYASVIIVTLALSYSLLNYFNKPAESKPFIVEVPKGESSVITLYDGTVVRLNSGSRLVCDSYTSKTERRVTLDGEGYFKVTHNAEIPFYVNMKSATVKVYGTEFSILAYNDDQYMQTTLVHGKVGVILPSGKEYVLKPNEMFEINESGKVNVKTIDIEKYTSWTKGYYIFKNESLETIARHVERIYDVKIVFDTDNLKNERYTGKIKTTDHILDVMQRLRMTSTFTMGYQLKNKEIHIYRR